MPQPTGPDPYELAAEAAQAIRDRFGIDGIDVSFTLGSGWAAAADDLGEEIGSCPLEELPGFSAP
ncbi:MAG TPA: purine-nucleoside phosphorylase, partial [Friedmanniella sp.]